MEIVIPKIITGCALTAPDNKICDPAAVDEALGIVGASNIDDAKTITGCNNVKCVIEEGISRGGSAQLRDSVQRHFKLKGPTDTRLLSNYDIDNTLSQWAAKFKDFFNYNFNMLNYEEQSFDHGRILNQPDTLVTISIKSLIERGFKCCACVINTDVYTGSGKHWMALFADWRTPAATVEFFNSSGNPPKDSFVRWMSRAADDLTVAGYKTTVVKVADIRHQLTKSECGVYSLLYIWSRLNNIDYSYFRGRRIPDEIMFEFRQHLFDGVNNGDHGQPFDIELFKKKVTIKWEQL